MNFFNFFNKQGLIVFLLLNLFSQFINSQENLKCESDILSEINPQGIPIPTLCQNHALDAWSKAIVLGGEGLKTDSDVFQMFGQWGLYAQLVIIEDDFTITTEFEFSYCIVRIAPGVEIIVGEDNGPEPTLTIDNSELFACQGLWAGINMQDESRVNLNLSIIEDALIALKVDAYKNTIKVEKTDFNRNKVGIQLGHNLIPGSTKVQILNFTGNEFTCTTPLNGSNEITLAGVDIQRLVGMNTLGSTQGDENLFKDIRYGIYNNQNSNCFLNVSNCTFESILIKGIFMKPTVVMNIKNCTFINNVTACIDLIRSDQLTVRGCQFTYNDQVLANFNNNLHYGIRFNPNGWSAVYNDQNITQNKFDVDFNNNTKLESVYCISMYGANDGAFGEHYFDTNIFNLSFQAGVRHTRAIDITNGIHASTENTIFDNEFTYTNIGANLPCYAVNISSGDYNNLTISDNRFLHSPTPIQPSLAGERGIRLSGSSGSNNSVTNNTFEDLNFNFSRAYSVGIETTDFDDTDFKINHIRECDNPFLFNGINESTQMICNILEGGSTLLKLDGGVIGDQGAVNDIGVITTTNGNKWFNTQELNAIDGICTPSNQSSLSRFFVKGQQSATNEFFPDQLNPSSNWFKGNGPETNCAFNLLQNNLEKKISSGEFADVINNKADTWEAKRYLFNKLCKDAALLNSYDGFQQFKMNHEGSTLAELSKVQQMIENSYVPSFELLQISKQLNDDITTLFDDAKNLDEQLYQNQNYELSQSRKTNQDKIIGKSMEIENHNVLVHSSITSKLIEAKIYNEQIVVADIWEINTKTMNTLIIDLALNQILSEDQWKKVRDIAIQCPRNGGMAVYKARGILPECEIVPEFHESNCIPSGERKSENQDTKFSDLHLFPNPNNNFFVLNTGNLMISSIEIQDLLGTNLFAQKITDNSSNFKIDHDFISGTYFCRIQFVTGKRVTIPFVVTK